ncbi:MAG TPA: heme lyase CcmF/NrfE family subunit, partial [Anaerolineae bacterium]|nr:heme lyase CcmF/NrfE family subunit [Anaerolineae bacterium]
MIADLGYAAIALAFLAAVYAGAASWYGSRTGQIRWAESARNATIVTFPLLLLAAGLLIISLLRSDFSLEYVWRVSSLEMPTYLKVTAMWGGQ